MNNHFLNFEVFSISSDVYSRLKALEDRLLLLERISPQVTGVSNEVKKYENERKEKLTKSLMDINNEISQLRNELMS